MSATQALLNQTEPESTMVSFTLPTELFNRLEHVLHVSQQRQPKITRSRLLRSFVEDSLTALEKL